MDSARESGDRGQMVGMPHIGMGAIVIVILVLVVEQMYEAAKLHSADELSDVCLGVWGCSWPSAAELLPVLALVAIAALLLSPVKRVEDEGGE